uniref:Large ribosomal subunit protein uL30m n=1 Tax=Blastobotrys adeninivorans TaxID=409370 RepID=A0A060TH92_BLAAD
MSGLFYRIRAIRSTIGLPKIKKDHFTALGLKKRGSVAYQRVCPEVAGQLMAVKELVNVQLVNKRLSPEEERSMRRPPRGFTVESS